MERARGTWPTLAAIQVSGAGSKKPGSRDSRILGPTACGSESCTWFGVLTWRREAGRSSSSAGGGCCAVSVLESQIFYLRTQAHTHTEAHAYAHTHRYTHNSCGSYPVFSGVQQDTTHFSGPFPARQKPSKEVVVLGCRVGLGPYKGLLFAAAASGVTSSLPGSLPTLGKVCYPLGIDLAGSVSIALALWARALLLKTWGEGRE